LIVFEGWDAAGKGTVLSRLLQPLDPRGFKVYTIKPPTEEERFYPPMWRFWGNLPPDGTIGIYDRSWYRQVLEEYVESGRDKAPVDAAYERIRVFERQLTDNGAIVVKFFLHISKKEQAKRFKKLEADLAFAWRVGDAERRQHRCYDEYAQAVEDMVRETSTPNAPWTLVPATDERFARVKVAETLAAALVNPLAARPPARINVPPDAPRRTSPLDRVDLTETASAEDYGAALAELQAELRRLQHLCYKERRPVAIVYEGWDAAGKGGNIRRLVRDLDPRGYEVVPFAAPEGDEKRHHYLWRFWRALPKAGHLTVFDRSWYGRVLVERVEGFALRRVGAGLSRNQRVRGRPRGLRNGGNQVLAAYLEGRATGAIRGAAKRAREALEDHGRGLAQPRKVGRVLAGGLRHGRADFDRARAVDHRRGGRQTPRPAQDTPHRGRTRRRGPLVSHRIGDEGWGTGTSRRFIRRR